MYDLVCVLDNANKKHHVYHLPFLTEFWYSKATAAAITCWAKEWVWGLNFNVLIIYSACDTEGKLTLTT